MTKRSGEMPVSRLKRWSVAGLAVVSALAAAGCVSSSGEGSAAPAPTRGIATGSYNPGDHLKAYGVAGPMKPDLARLAIATGMKCDFVPGGAITVWPSVEVNGKRISQVDLPVQFTQGPASAAAESQYWTSRAVQWDGNPEVTTTIYTLEGGRMVATPGTTMVGGDYAEASATVSVDTQQLQDGATIVIGSRQLVESWNPQHHWTQTDVTCGAFTVDVAHKAVSQVSLPSAAVPGSLVTDGREQPWPVAA